MDAIIFKHGNGKDSSIAWSISIVGITPLRPGITSYHGLRGSPCRRHFFAICWIPAGCVRLVCCRFSRWRGCSIAIGELMPLLVIFQQGLRSMVREEAHMLKVWRYRLGDHGRRASSLIISASWQAQLYIPQARQRGSWRVDWRWS